MSIQEKPRQSRAQPFSVNWIHRELLTPVGPGISNTVNERTKKYAQRQLFGSVDIGIGETEFFKPGVLWHRVASGWKRNSASARVNFGHAELAMGIPDGNIKGLAQTEA